MPCISAPEGNEAHQEVIADSMRVFPAAYLLSPSGPEAERSQAKAVVYDSVADIARPAADVAIPAAERRKDERRECRSAADGGADDADGGADDG